MSDYTAIQELRPYRHLSGTSDWTIIVVPYLKMLARNKTSIFSHVQFLIRQFSYDGTISRFNRLSIHNKNFLPKTIHAASSIS